MCEKMLFADKFIFYSNELSETKCYSTIGLTIVKKATIEYLIKYWFDKEQHINKKK